MRSMLSILLIGVPVTLILTLVGLSQGIIDESAKRSRGVGADVIVRAPGTTMLSFSGAPLPEALVPMLAKWPHVKLATGTVNHGAGGMLEIVTGIDVDAFNKMSGGFTFLEGHTFERPDDIVIDQYYAQQRKVHAGDTTQLLNRPWHVAGVVAPGKLSRIFLPIGILQELTANRNRISQIYLKVDDPKNIPEVVSSLKAKLGDEYPIMPMEQLISLTSVDNVPGLRPFINVIVGIAVVIAFAVVCLSMYMAVLQRTREIGILKSLGASKWFILQIILAEALFLGFGGTVLGIVLSFGTRALLAVFVPASLPQAIVPGWWPIAGLIAVGAALLGGLYPGLTAARQDPIEALAYE